MCRHVAYLGPPRPLADLLITPPHSLVHQSWAPRQMRGGGTINADGFGVGWYPEPRVEPTTGGVVETLPGRSCTPVRYRQPGPIWSDPSLPGLAAGTRSGAVLAAVRSATAGMPVTAQAAAPFGTGRWLFSHNGVVRGWPTSVVQLAERLPTVDLLTLESATDAALLWALVRHELHAGASLADALARTTRDVARVAPGSRVNLLITDGLTAAATTLGHSLWLRRTEESVHLASEPLDDDPGWREVPDGRLLSASPDHLDLTELPTP
jgi:glutamine amidotransferase